MEIIRDNSLPKRSTILYFSKNFVMPNKITSFQLELDFFVYNTGYLFIELVCIIQKYCDVSVLLNDKEKIIAQF